MPYVNPTGGYGAIFPAGPQDGDLTNFLSYPGQPGNPGFRAGQTPTLWPTAYRQGTNAPHNPGFLTGWIVTNFNPGSYNPAHYRSVAGEYVNTNLASLYAFRHPDLPSGAGLNPGGYVPTGRIAY